MIWTWRGKWRDGHYQRSLDVDFLEWYGWRNPNSCVLSLYGRTASGCEWCVTVLPLLPWHFVEWSLDRFKDRAYSHPKSGPINKKRRVVIGIGLLEWYADFRI